MVYVKVTLTGTQPMLVHSQEGMNRSNPKARELSILNKKRGKTDDDLDKISDLEMELGLYWDKERDVPVMPVFNIVRCIQDGAKLLKGGKQVIQALRLIPTAMNAEIIYGEKKTKEQFIASPEHRDVRTVTVSGTVNRTRPRFDRWAIEAYVLVDEKVLQLDQLNAYIEKAGLYVGLGDFRVGTKKGGRYGTFEGKAEIVKTIQ